jgi:hypothetical protein
VVDLAALVALLATAGIEEVSVPPLRGPKTVFPKKKGKRKRKETARQGHSKKKEKKSDRTRSQHVVVAAAVRSG